MKHKYFYKYVIFYIICITMMLIFSSCSLVMEYPDEDCNRRIYIHTQVESSTVKSYEISSENPMKLYILTKYGESKSFNSKGIAFFYISEDGILKSKHCNTLWNDKTIKYIACWPSNAEISVDEQGNITFVSEDCRLIGESEIIVDRVRNTSLTLRDYHPINNEDN